MRRTRARAPAPAGPAPGGLDPDAGDREQHRLTRQDRNAQPGRRPRRASPRAHARHAGLVVLVPVLAYAAWQTYAGVHYGGAITSSGSAYLPPFVGVVDEVRHALNDKHLRDTVWDLCYLALMVAGVAVAAALVARRVSAAGVAALLFGCSLLVVVFGDPWSYTRLSAPMLAALLLAGREQRSRAALAVCALGALLSLALPLTPWLGSG